MGVNKQFTPKYPEIKLSSVHLRLSRGRARKPTIPLCVSHWLWTAEEQGINYPALLACPRCRQTVLGLGEPSGRTEKWAVKTLTRIFHKDETQGKGHRTSTAALYPEMCVSSQVYFCPNLYRYRYAWIYVSVVKLGCAIYLVMEPFLFSMIL